MQTWDVVIIGGGIIGLSLSIALRKRGARVLIVERGEPGREASHAAAGMLAHNAAENPPALQPLAQASARMYPEFVHGLQDESGIDVDLRDEGTLVFPVPGQEQAQPATPLPAPLSELEPALANGDVKPLYLKERSVDPRALSAAALKSAKHRSVDIASGTAVVQVLLTDGRASGVITDKTTYPASAVVNCAGAWAGHIPPHAFPTRPRKGQMLALVGPSSVVRHVIRAPEVYLVPRTDGRVIIGSTVEDAGYDKRTDPAVIQRLQQAAIARVPGLAELRILEAWAGLRPGTQDDLPILGATSTPGYFVATGHFRDGILLAPITAHVMAQLMTGSKVEYDLTPFWSGRFST